MGGQVEREVERADRRDRADREAPGDPDPVLRGRQQVERDQLAGHPLGLLGAEPEGQGRPVDLDQRVADRLAGLERDEPAELLAPRPEPGADLAQDPAALVGRQLAGDLEGGDGGLDRLLVLGLGGVVGRCRRASTGRPGCRRRGRRATRPSGRRGRSDGAWCRRRRSSWRSPMGYVAIVQPALAPPCDHEDPPWPDRPTSARRAPGQARRTRPAGEARPGRDVRLRQGDSAEPLTASQLTRLRDAPGPALGGGEARRSWSSSRASMPPARTAPSSKVMEAFNPQGCPVSSFKVPTPEELGHDYLWRIHKRTPGKGEIGIFNRSHYEDVLVVRVHDLVPTRGLVDALRPDQRLRARRSPRAARPSSSSSCRSIATSSASASRRATTTRRSAGSSRSATSRSASAGTTTRRRSTTRCRRRRPPAAPWYVIPANRNWFRNLAVSTILADTMAGLKPAYPAPPDLPPDLVIE